MKKSALIIKLMLTLFCLFYANISVSGTLYSSIAYSVYQQVINGAVQQVNAGSQAANSGIPDENWSMEYKHNLILIPMGDLVVPIEISKPEVILKHDDRGRIVFSDGKVRSVTRTELVKYEYNTGVVNNYRPTLFVSIGGFNTDSSTDYHEQWQLDMDAKLVAEAGYYQYKHFLVEWDSKLSLRTQVGDLAGVIKDFLDKRVDSWDVVLVGHSRGGIFVHELTKELVGYPKITNLHSFLLDPTAATRLSDNYPSHKYEAAPTVHYGSLYYDNNVFIDNLYLSYGTIGDINISGYDNYGRNNHYLNSTHELFGVNWIAATNNGFNTALNDIRARKTMGSFVPDEAGGTETVIITAEKGFVIDGAIEITDGNIQIWNDISAGGLSLVSLQAAIGKDGIDVAGATAVSYSRIIINNDQIAVTNSDVLSTYTASISHGSLTANASFIFVGGSASMNSNETTIRLNIYGWRPSATVNTNVVTGGAQCLVSLFTKC